MGGQGVSVGQNPVALDGRPWVIRHGEILLPSSVRDRQLDRRLSSVQGLVPPRPIQ
jgi:hypothetical protein